MLEELKEEQIETTLEANQEEVETTPTNNQDESARIRENAAELNLQKLRMIAEQNAWRAEQAEARLKQFESQRTPPPQEDDDLDSDDILDKKEYKKYHKSIKNDLKETRDEIAKLRAENERFQNIAAEETLKNKHKGFASIVNKANLDRLKEEDYTLYKSIMSNDTLLERGEVAYKILKPFLAEKQNYDDTNARLEANKSRPKSAATVAGQDTPVDPLSVYKDKARWKPEVKWK